MGTVHQLSAHGQSVSSGSATLEPHYQIADESAAPCSGAVGAPFLGWLSMLMPAAARHRFVAEELGNVGGLRRWDRIIWLAVVAAGMPRLAWTIRRENRRGRL